MPVHTVQSQPPQTEAFGRFGTPLAGLTGQISVFGPRPHLLHSSSGFRFGIMSETPPLAVRGLDGNRDRTPELTSYAISSNFLCVKLIRCAVNVRGVTVRTRKMIVTGRLRAGHIDVTMTKTGNASASGRGDIAIVPARTRRRNNEGNVREGIIMKTRLRRRGRSVGGGGGRGSVNSRTEIGHLRTESLRLVSLNHIEIGLGRVIGHIDRAMSKRPV